MSACQEIALRDVLDIANRRDTPSLEFNTEHSASVEGLYQDEHTWFQIQSAIINALETKISFVEEAGPWMLAG